MWVSTLASIVLESPETLCVLILRAAGNAFLGSIDRGKSLPNEAFQLQCFGY